MISQNSEQNLISADNENGTLRAVIVGSAELSCFPHEPAHMIEATMPSQFQDQFKPNNPFPSEIIAGAVRELDGLASLLESLDVKVYRPRSVDWRKCGGYTGAMPRDALLTVGNTIIEAPFTWSCRWNEVPLAYNEILNALESNKFNRVIRAPRQEVPNMLYSGIQQDGTANDVVNGHGAAHRWAINNSRPAFDAADFMRFGTLILGQLSNVTNMKGVEYLQAHVPPGYTVELLEVDDPHAMHIDATILPLRDGLLIYNPLRTSEAAIRRHQALKDWDCRACPTPRQRGADEPPLFMTSNWLMMNIISIDDKTVIVEESDTEFADWLNTMGIETIKLPFKHVHSIGGSFHCATVDIERL